MHSMKTRTQTTTRVTAILAFAVSAAAAPFEITRSTIDGGGVMRSTGGAFELSRTIGQPDAGKMTGGAFQLTGGFWFEAPPGDCQSDGKADLLDFDLLAGCLTGPAIPVSGQCRCFDLDGSGTIDLADFGDFARALMPH